MLQFMLSISTITTITALTLELFVSVGSKSFLCFFFVTSVETAFGSSWNKARCPFYGTTSQSVVSFVASL